MGVLNRHYYGRIAGALLDAVEFSVLCRQRGPDNERSTRARYAWLHS